MKLFQFHSDNCNFVEVVRLYPPVFVTLTFLVISLILPITVNADFYKCVSKDGKITFTDGPCPRGEYVNVIKEVPATNVSLPIKAEQKESSKLPELQEKSSKVKRISTKSVQSDNSRHKPKVSRTFKLTNPKDLITRHDLSISKRRLDSSAKNFHRKILLEKELYDMKKYKTKKDYSDRRRKPHLHYRKKTF